MTPRDAETVINSSRLRETGDIKPANVTAGDKYDASSGQQGRLARRIRADGGSWR
jgi:hypothetical protein